MTSAVSQDFYDQMAMKWTEPEWVQARARAENRMIEEMDKENCVTDYTDWAGWALREGDSYAAPIAQPKVNKKDAVGATKADTAAIPSAAIFALGAAMADGAKKYDAYNYRDSEVKASVFHNAMNRHHWDWWEGEDFAPDSLVHHLAHQMACCAILLDAISVGNLIDDRPKTKILGASRMTSVWKDTSHED